MEQKIQWKIIYFRLYIGVTPFVTLFQKSWWSSSMWIFESATVDRIGILQTLQTDFTWSHGVFQWTWVHPFFRRRLEMSAVTRLGTEDFPPWNYNSLHLKMDGWKTIRLPIGASSAYFQGLSFLLVSGAILLVLRFLLPQRRFGHLSIVTGSQVQSFCCLKVGFHSEPCVDGHSELSKWLQ